MLTKEQIAYRTGQIRMAQSIPESAWLKFYIPESSMPHFPRADDASLGKRKFHTHIADTKKRIRDMASMIRHNFGLSPLNSHHQSRPMLTKLDAETIEWRRRELEKTAELPNSLWLTMHHPGLVPKSPNVYGMYKSKRQFYEAVFHWRAAIKELVSRLKQ